MSDRSSPADLARSAAMMGNQNARKTASVDGRTDPRKVMRLTEPERALIATAIAELVQYGPTLTDDETELAAEILRRMT